MTIKQLKKILDTYDENFQVYVRGYEGGCDNLKKTNLTRVKKNVNKESYA